LNRTAWGRSRYLPSRRVGELLSKAEPALLERVKALAEAILQGLASEIEKP
jgi:hypothetical protein